ncbi:hypothetical protein PV326_013655, partial [Microctonus aethiopoides]
RYWLYSYSKYRRTLQDPTCIAEDSLKTCNLERTEELNACEMEKIMDQEEFPFQQQAGHKSEHIKLTDQRRCGLRTLFYFECEMCGQVDKVWSEPDHKITNSLNINQAAVVGSRAAGFGYAQMEQMLAAMSISCM